MITFKQFLSESRTKVMDVHDATIWMESHASGYLKKGTFLYRGVAGGSKGGLTFGDASSGAPRTSLNTYNNYTLWMDNNPMFHGKPRRGNAFITTTSSDIASIYGSVFIVVPADNAKTGIVGKSDMWDVTLSSLGYSILNLNEETADAFYHFDKGRPKTYEELESALRSITLDMIEENEDLEDSTNLATLMRSCHVNTLYGLWTDLVTPNLFKYTTGKDINGKGEIWIDGEAVFIPLNDKYISESDRFAVFAWAQDNFPQLAKELGKYWEDEERIDPDTVSDKDTLTYTQKRKQK
ncbi:hypothetical protein [Acinetobacter sp.]|uniref:hypothetical protein n=1 Tax=Acinetobacter sp. TaxID=472 RepID=UPI0038906917